MCDLSIASRCFVYEFPNKPSPFRPGNSRNINISINPLAKPLPVTACLACFYYITRLLGDQDMRKKRYWNIGNSLGKSFKRRIYGGNTVIEVYIKHEKLVNCIYSKWKPAKLPNLTFKCVLIEIKLIKSSSEKIWSIREIQTKAYLL